MKYKQDKIFKVPVFELDTCFIDLSIFLELRRCDYGETKQEGYATASIMNDRWKWMYLASAERLK